MNIILKDRANVPHDFTNRFGLFSAHSGLENQGGQRPSRLSREELNAFFSAESDDAHSAHLFNPPNPPAEPPKPKLEKDLAAGVLKQAARDLRRFRAATKGAKRELYLDAYKWITAYDFSWPYSFVNVCKLFDVCPEIIRAELLADASLCRLHYWTRRADRLSKKVKSSFVRVFASCRDPRGRRPRPAGFMYLSRT